MRARLSECFSVVYICSGQEHSLPVPCTLKALSGTWGQKGQTNRGVALEASLGALLKTGAKGRGSESGCSPVAVKEKKKAETNSKLSLVFSSACNDCS